MKMKPKIKENQHFPASGGVFVFIRTHLLHLHPNYPMECGTKISSGILKQRISLILFFIVRHFKHFYVFGFLFLLLRCHAIRDSFSTPLTNDAGASCRRRKVWQNGTRNFFDLFPFQMQTNKKTAFPNLNVQLKVNHLWYFIFYYVAFAICIFVLVYAFAGRGIVCYAKRWEDRRRMDEMTCCINSMRMQLVGIPIADKRFTNLDRMNILILKYLAVCGQQAWIF